jgi:hypothetical protein
MITFATLLTLALTKIEFGLDFFIDNARLRGKARIALSRLSAL